MDSFLIRLAATVGDKIDIDVPKVPAEQVLQNALNIVYFLAGSICVVIIIVAGIMYATSAGNAQSVTRAKNMLLFSIIGLVVIALAFVITQFVIGRFS